MSNHSGDDDWDPNHLRLAGGAPAAQEPTTRGGRRVSPVKGKFIAGPIDVAWLSQASKLGVTALWVGLALWFVRGLRGADSFLVSNLMMRDWGVLPDAKSRALRKLEQAGLIAIEGRGKRSPRVSLVVQARRLATPPGGTPSVMGSRPQSPNDFAKDLGFSIKKAEPGHGSLSEDELIRKNSPDVFAKNGDR